MNGLYELIQSQHPAPGWPAPTTQEAIPLRQPIDPSRLTPPIGLMDRPEPPPAAPQQPVDESMIRRFVALAGREPQRPPLEEFFSPAGRGEWGKVIGQSLAIAADELLGGGTLRQQREQARQGYQRDLQAFERTKRELGLMGLQQALKESQDLQDRKQYEADLNYKFDIAERTGALQLWKEEQQERLKNDLLQRREQIQRDVEDRRQQVKERALQLKDARQFAAKFWLEGTPPQIAHEIGEYLTGLRDDVSPDALKWATARSRLSEMRLNKLSSRQSGGTSAAPMRDKAMAKAVELFETTKRALEDATARGDQQMIKSLRSRLQSMATNLAARYGDKLEVGSGEWPYQKLRGKHPQAPAEGQQMHFDLSQPHGEEVNIISLAELQEIAKRRGISVDEARRMAESEGLIVR